jgi:hypothetical protein
LWGQIGGADSQQVQKGEVKTKKIKNEKSNCSMKTNRNRKRMGKWKRKRKE